MAEGKSVHNTPDTFAYVPDTSPLTMISVYMAGLMFKWIEAHGGLKAMEERSRTKAGLLYAYLEEAADFYPALVEPAFRSSFVISSL